MRRGRYKNRIALKVVFDMDGDPKGQEEERRLSESYRCLIEWAIQDFFKNTDSQIELSTLEVKWPVK